MLKTLFSITALAALMTPAFGADGTTLINQATVNAAGGFPYHINTTGSYRLAGNLVAMNTTALIIGGGNITLDLNGFTITCLACSGVPGILSNNVNTTIQNGLVNGFAGGTALSFTTTGAKVDHIIETASGTGIGTSGPDVTVTNSSLLNNTYGIGGASAQVTAINCIITGNIQDGIDVFSGLIAGNIISNNGNGGTFTRGGVIFFGGIVNVRDNLISGNTVFGVGIGNSTNAGVLGLASNTFGGNINDYVVTVNIVTNHSNVCAGGTC